MKTTYIDPYIKIYESGTNQFYIEYADNGYSTIEVTGTLEQAKLAALKAARKHYQKLADTATEEIFKILGAYS